LIRSTTSCPRTAGTGPVYPAAAADPRQEAGITIPFTFNTPYVNTIPADKQPAFSREREVERRIKSIIRWNAMAMVVRANKHEAGIGGHISSYASAATLYEIAFNHFIRAKQPDAAATRSISGTFLTRDLRAGAF